MIGAEIFDGGIVIVDRSIKPKHDHIVIAAEDNEFTIKPFYCWCIDCGLVVLNIVETIGFCKNVPASLNGCYEACTPTLVELGFFYN